MMSAGIIKYWTPFQKVSDVVHLTRRTLPLARPPSLVVRVTFPQVHPPTLLSRGVEPLPETPLEIFFILFFMQILYYMFAIKHMLSLKKSPFIFYL